MLSSLSDFCEMLEKRQFSECAFTIYTCKPTMFFLKKLFLADYVGTCQNQY